MGYKMCDSPSKCEFSTVDLFFERGLHQHQRTDQELPRDDGAYNSTNLSGK